MFTGITTTIMEATEVKVMFLSLMLTALLANVILAGKQLHNMWCYRLEI